MAQMLQNGQKLVKTQPLAKGIIAVDNGGRYIKVAKPDGKEPWILEHPIPSEKCYGWERSIGDEADAEYDFVIEWNGELYFAGNLAIRETSAMKLDGFTKTKNTDFFILSILIAIHQYGYDENHVVTCIPIEQKGIDREAEKIAITQSLIKEHTITINGVEKTFTVKNALVVQEGINAFWVDEPFGKVRWLDIGSRTVNFATTLVKDEQVFPIAGESGTLPNGIEKMGVTNYSNFAKSLEGQLGQRSWDTNDKIYIIGGGAKNTELVEKLQEIYPNAEVPNDPQNLQVLGMLAMGEFEASVKGWL